MSAEGMNHAKVCENKLNPRLIDGTHLAVCALTSEGPLNG